MFYFNQQMLNSYGKDSSVTAMVDKMDWVIMPVFNVDGYEYSHTTVSLFLAPALLSSLAKVE